MPTNVLSAMRPMLMSDKCQLDQGRANGHLTDQHIQIKHYSAYSLDLTVKAGPSSEMTI